VILVKNSKKHLIFIAEKSQGERRKYPSPLRIFQKKSPTENSWAFYVWWGGGNRQQTMHELLMQVSVGWCGLAWSRWIFIEGGWLLERSRPVVRPLPQSASYSVGGFICHARRRRDTMYLTFNGG
jgi:hypothetical protein